MTQSGTWSFLLGAGTAWLDPATGLYKYYVDGNDMYYEDADVTGKLHLLVVNLDAAVTKPAYGAGGHLRVCVNLEEVLGA